MASCAKTCAAWYTISATACTAVRLIANSGGSVASTQVSLSFPPRLAPVSAAGRSWIGCPMVKAPGCDTWAVVKLTAVAQGRVQMIAVWGEVPDRTPVAVAVEGVDLVVVRQGDEHSCCMGDVRTEGRSWQTDPCRARTWCAAYTVGTIDLIQASAPITTPRRLSASRVGSTRRTAGSM